jgi:hypothetical protein
MRVLEFCWKFVDNVSCWNWNESHNSDVLSLQLSVKRDREAFFKSDSYQPKFDPHGHKANEKINSEKEDNLQNTPKLDKLYKENTNVDGYVGFANLPNQVYRKSVKRGFEFNLMVVGRCHFLSFFHLVWWWKHKNPGVFVSSTHGDRRRCCLYLAVTLAVWNRYRQFLSSPSWMPGLENTEDFRMVWAGLVR